jgi:ribonuclease-3
LSSDKTFTRQLSKVLGFIPTYLHFYKRAFTHKSVHLTKKSRLDVFDPYVNLNNERLEFLGDAILDAVMAEYLFKKYPLQDEGFLTQMRSKMVNRRTLNKISADMGLDFFLKQRGTSNISQTMMGNTFEAFLGAVYLDAGYFITRKFIIQRVLRRYVDVHELEQVNDNYKSLLLEYCQKNQKVVSYEILEHSRTASNREKFKVAVLVDGFQVAVAEDYNKKSAEQTASKYALNTLGFTQNDKILSENNSTAL